MNRERERYICVYIYIYRERESERDILFNLIDYTAYARLVELAAEVPHVGGGPVAQRAGGLALDKLVFDMF